MVAGANEVDAPLGVGGREIGIWGLAWSFGLQFTLALLLLLLLLLLLRRRRGGGAAAAAAAALGCGDGVVLVVLVADVGGVGVLDGDWWRCWCWCC